MYDKAAIRGTTDRLNHSHARMAMIEPISWDLNEEKVQPSPTTTPIKETHSTSLRYAQGDTNFIRLLLKH